MATNPPITIGELVDVPAPGSGVKSQWCQEITNRIHHRFATPAARLAAFTAPNPVATKGQASYLTTGAATEGPEWFNGVAWRRPWNMPWGIIASSTNVAGQAGIGTAPTDVAGLAVAAAVGGNRIIKVTAWLLATAATGASAYVTDNPATTSYVQGSVGPLAGYSQIISLTALLTTAAAQVQATFKVRIAAASGTVNVVAGPTFPALIMVEDVGPAAGAPT